MVIEIIDRSGQPRTDEELEEALTQVEQIMFKHILEIPPSLAVQMSTIRSALLELIGMRKVRS